MEKDLIIGGASNYSWKELKYWVGSLKKTGFSGDIVLVATNMKNETVEQLKQLGITLFLYGNQNENKDYVHESKMPPHVERFFYLWYFLENTKNFYRNVIVTDTRDVLFQENPSFWLNNNLILHNIVAASEGMLYKDEPWNDRNLLQTFGSFFYENLNNNFIYNVGVIAGRFEYVKSLMLMIFQMSINRQIPIVDQAVYNFILNIPFLKRETLFANNTDHWAVNLATTLGAIESKSGDIGMIMGANSDSIQDYIRKYKDVQPIVEEDGTVKNYKGVKFSIVHQWDRISKLKNIIESKY